MKLAVDMFACQTKFRFRGISRYTFSLVQSLVKNRENNDVLLLADSLYNDSFNFLRHEFLPYLPSKSFIPYYHRPVTHDTWENFFIYGEIAGSLVKQAYQNITPDILLTPSFIDGLFEDGFIPFPDNNQGFLHAVIVYDLIPYIFREKYLDPNPELTTWYMKRLNALNQFDLILAISESTKKDLVNLLNIDQEKIINISGAPNPIFKKIKLAPKHRNDYMRRFNITRPFVLYIGGDDFRKNMVGALRAFARLPEQNRKNLQLVLNDVGDQTAFFNKVNTLGLETDDVVITGRLTDDELVALYNMCKVSIFPSLYEGFGLPILEAMACGAPVLASNNSSIPEVIGREDATFDVSNEQSFVDKLTRAVTDESFLSELSNFGIKRSANFSWERTANYALASLEDLVAQKKNEGKHIYTNSSGKYLPRIAYVSPLPPDKSGIAQYSAALLPYLQNFFDIDLFTDPHSKCSDKYIDNNFRIYPWTDLLKKRNNYETVVYQVGNSEFHTYMVDLLFEFPGVVVTHDFFLSNLAFLTSYLAGDEKKFLSILDESHGLRALLAHAKNGIDATIKNYPINRKILANSVEIIVHSAHQKKLMNDFYKYGWQPTLNIINHLRILPSDNLLKGKTKYREDLNLSSETFVFCSFGIMAPTKLDVQIIKAFSEALTLSNKNLMLIFVGMKSDGAYGDEIEDLIDELDLNEHIRITGFVSKEDYEKYLTCANAAIQLRSSTRGETSGAVLDTLAFGLPTIINAHGSLNDYDSAYVGKLSEYPDTKEITDLMLSIIDNENFWINKGKQAQNLIRAEFDPQKIADQYRCVITRAILKDERKLFAPLFDNLVTNNADEVYISNCAKDAAKNNDIRTQPRILINLFKNDAFLSDQNLIREKVSEIKQMFSIEDKAIWLDLVNINDHSIVRSNSVVEKLFQLPPNRLGPDVKISVLPGDILFFNYKLCPKFEINGQTIELVKSKGGKVVFLIDEISTLPSFNFLIKSDQILCLSADIANEINEKLIANNDHHSQPYLYYYTAAKQSPKKDVNSAFNNNIEIELDWHQIFSWILTMNIDNPPFIMFKDQTNQI